MACAAVTAGAQSIGLSAGGIFPSDLQEAVGGSGAAARAEFSTARIISVDAGMNLLPFISGEIHYSHSTPELLLVRADAFGSRAQIDLSSHTLTFGGRLRTPEVFGVRLYGLLGAGLSRFNLDVREQVEQPFPQGAPEKLLAPVLTYGGGFERGLLPLVRWKFEVRDDVSPISEKLFGPGGTWHRVQVTAGIVIGR
jgi:hypothetical protein